MSNPITNRPISLPFTNPVKPATQNESGSSSALASATSPSIEAEFLKIARMTPEERVQAAPVRGHRGEPLERLLASMTSYVDYVRVNYEGYASIVRAAQGGNEALRRLHEQARNVLTDRIFTADAQGEVIPDTPAARLAVRGWSAMTEELVLTWAADPGDVTREQLLTAVTDSLPALVALPTR